MSIWKLLAIGVGVVFLPFYAYGLWLYLWGKGREKIEGSVKALLILKKNGGSLEIVRRGRGVILVFYLADGQLSWADLRLRIPFRTWSLPLSTELQQVFSRNGFEFKAIDGSIEWVGELRIVVDDIWAVGSAARAAVAANLALDILGFAKDARFIYQLKGKMSSRLRGRQGRL